MDKQDLINRQDAIYLCQERLYETACNSIGYGCKADELYADIAKHRIKDWLEELPSAEPEILACGEGELSAQPERKKGKWIILDECANEGVYCSVCHKKVLKIDYSNTMKKWKNFNYCPNCGADMRPDNAPLADDSIYDRSGRTGGN